MWSFLGKFLFPIKIVSLRKDSVHKASDIKSLGSAEDETDSELVKECLARRTKIDCPPPSSLDPGGNVYQTRLSFRRTIENITIIILSSLLKVSVVFLLSVISIGVHIMSILNNL